MTVTSKAVRFSVEEYFRMCEADVFNGRRVELINGRIYRMHAQGTPHMSAITKGAIVLSRHFGDMTKYWLCVQGTLRLPPLGAPDPDFMVYDVPVNTPRQNLPTPLIVIEVSDTTYRRDKGVKLRHYAEGGIEDYWIENLAQRRVEVHRDPVNDTGTFAGWRFADVRNYHPGERISMLAKPNVLIDVDDLLS